MEGKEELQGSLCHKGTRQPPIAGGVPSAIRRKHAETPAVHLNLKQVDRTILHNLTELMN